MRKSCFHILHIIIFSWIVLFIGPRQAAAQEAAASANYELRLNIREDYSADVEYLIALTNTSTTDLLDYFEMQFPFTSMTEPLVFSNGQGIPATFYTSGATSHLELRFGSNALRPSESRQLNVRFSTTSLMHEEYGIFSFVLPALDTTYSIGTATLSLAYPGNLPPLVYTSAGMQAENVPHIVTLDCRAGALIIWAPKEVIFDVNDDSVVTLPDSGSSVMANLIPDNAYQEVLFHKLEGTEMAGTDRVGNVWGVFSPGVAKFSMLARVLSKKKEEPPPFVDVPYATLEFSSDKFPFMSGSELEVATQAYERVLQFLTPEMDFRQTTKAELNAVINLQTTQTTSLGYSYLLASYLYGLGIKAHVAYGYLTTPVILGIDMTKPLTWVEAEVDGQIVMLDPYLADLTGFRFFDFPFQTRLAYGIWLPEMQEDSVLGMLVGSFRERPSLAKFADFTPSPVSYEINAVFPQKAFAGEYYGGLLSIHNYSNYVIPIADIMFDGTALSNSQVYLTAEVKRALLPQKTTAISVDYQREPNFLNDGDYEKEVTLIPAHKLFAPQTAIFSITFVPDQRLLIGILGLIIVLIFILFLFQVRLIRRRLLLGRK